MSSISPAASGFALQRISNSSSHVFTTPIKRIHDGDGLSFFLNSTGYRDLMTWLLQLNRSVYPIKDSKGAINACRCDRPPPYSKAVEDLRSLVLDLSGLIDQAPPNTGPRRFGNVAFRTWHELVEDAADDILNSRLSDVLHQSQGESRAALTEELKVYLLGSLGSAQRLDYGTGHELSFLAFLGCLWKLDTFAEGEESAIVIGIVQPYLELIRRLVLTYTLEPAGSHGVWGLDDHSFIPYIFGSAQYGPAIVFNNASTTLPTEGSLKESPAPKRVTDKELVSIYRTQNMYFSAIQFIYDVKKGPFWEHSPVLYDISGIKDGWAKINKGMLKMYAAEVLGKFPVVQHFAFGSFFRWEADPAMEKQQASLHAQQQPAARPRSMDVPPAPPPMVGTKAPWANAGVGTGVPSTSAPWEDARANVATQPATSSPGSRILPNRSVPDASPRTMTPSNARI